MVSFDEVVRLSIDIDSLTVAGTKFEGNDNQLVSILSYLPQLSCNTTRTMAVIVISGIRNADILQWEAQTTATEFWRFKNVQFGLYLGAEKGRVAANDLAIRGVSHPFDWAPKRTEEEAGRSVFKYVLHAILATSHCVRQMNLKSIRLFIPFSKQALHLDEDGDWTIGGVKIKTWSDLGNSRPAQKWIIDSSMYHFPSIACFNPWQRLNLFSDTTFEGPVRAGKTYVIVGCHTGTVVQLEGTGNGTLSSFVYLLKGLGLSLSNPQWVRQSLDTGSMVAKNKGYEFLILCTVSPS